MTKAATEPHPDPIREVRDPATGQFITVRGLGALKGRLRLKNGIDLTKPIAFQALNLPKATKSAKR